MSTGDDEPLPKTIPLPRPRSLTSKERALIDFLLAGPLGCEELVRQAATAQVDGICGCGCRSVQLATDPSLPAAEFNPEEFPSAPGWVPLFAVQRKARGRGGTDVILHVVEGRLFELEIWTGGYGVQPRVDLAKLEYDERASRIGNPKSASKHTSAVATRSD